MRSHVNSKSAQVAHLLSTFVVKILQRRNLFYLIFTCLWHTALQAICTEAGMLALRERRMKITQEDLRQAKEKALYRKKGDIPEGLYL